MLDKLCNECIEKRPNTVVPWILMASFLYYHKELSLLSDGLFDSLCKRLLENWDGISHTHKHLIHEGDLAAGTLFSLSEMSYPSMVKGASIQLYSEVN